MTFRYKILSVFFLFIIFNKSSYAQKIDVKWLEDSRYGMFIHWGLYSAAEGLWKGENLRYANNYAEWIKYRNRISTEEYGQLAKRFNWKKINPEEWVLQAKKSGMKYIIMTTKHHDGVAIWDTSVGDYSLPKLSGNNRDVIRELADACRKHGLKLGFYYSHWIDWQHPFAWDHNQELIGHVNDEQFDQYWQEKAIPQLRELLTNYGDIAVMWFDMWIPYQETIFKKQQLEEAAKLIRELQPNCLINSRLGLPAESEYVDFQTLGDNEFGKEYRNYPWETPGTIAHSWGYNGQETEWKSTSQLFKSLIRNVSLNGDFTLNIGPRADGSLPHESTSRLDEIGYWLGNYGESIYGASGIKELKNRPDWGEITHNSSKKSIYLHIFNWPLDNILRVTGIESDVSNIELFSPSNKRKLDFDKNGPIIHIQLPANQTDPYVSVVKINYQELLFDSDVIPESTFGGFALTGQNAMNNSNITHHMYDGKKPTYSIVQSNNSLKWKVYFPKAGKYKIDISAHNPSQANTKTTISLDGKTTSADIAPTGKVVAEPNENNYVEEFVNTRIGEITVSKAGYHEVSFTAGNSIWINRIWVDQ